MKKLMYIFVITLFYLPQARSQGMTNNGAYIKIASGTIIRITGIKGNFVNNKSGTLNGKVQNDGKIFVQGNWTNYADAGNLFINRNTVGEVIFNGTTSQNIGGPQVSSFESLRLNNTYGTSPQIVLLTNTTVDNQLKMLQGNTEMSGQTLTLGKTTAAPGILSHAGTASNGWMYGGSFTRYFNTPVIADRNVSGMFPLGSSLDFRPLYISYPSYVLASGGTITLSHTSATTVSNVSFADGASTVIRRNDSYWTSSTSGGFIAAGSPFNVSVEGTGFGLITDVSNLRLTLVGSVVANAGTNSGTTLNPEINRTGLSLLNLNNDFYPASVSLASPLPIELLSFEAVCDNGKVNLNWATATETNNDFFTIYKSQDADTWVELISITGAGNSNKAVNYSYTDYNYQGSTAYYRLKQTDYDGKSVWFNTSFVTCNIIDDSSISLNPNPFNRFIILNIKDASQIKIYELRIYNYLGAEVLKTAITNPITMLEASNLPSGLYSYKVSIHDIIIQSGKLISLK
jgi:hypothetical protein